MKLTEVIIRRPVSAIVIIAAILIFGVGSLFTMPQELTPEMEMPMFLIMTSYPGAGPKDVDKLVSQEIESSVGSLSGIKDVSSISRENISIVVLQYDYGTNMDIAYTDLKSRIDTSVRSLPDSAGDPLVMEMDMNAMPSIILSITSGTMENFFNFVEDDLVPEFEKLPSVVEVSMSGGREDYIRVELIPERLQQYGLTMGSVSSSVASANFSMPIGSAEHGTLEPSLRTEVKYETVDSLNNVPIPIGNGHVIRLSDVANVHMSTKDASTISRFNGNDNISMSFQKKQSTSAVSVSREVKSTIARLEQEYPEIDFEVISDNSEAIQDSIRSVGQTLIIAVLLSMVVLYLFLGDVKASMIVGSSMPVSLLITFVFMNLMGFTLNVVSLSGMVLGVGMMVDNSIVVIDSCFKSASEERTIRQSVLEGTRSVMLSIIASTITTIVVFLPLAMMEGLSGQMFKPLGFTIVFSLVASLISAITLVPLFFVQFQPKERRNAPVARFMRKLERGYGKLLRVILNKKKTVFVSLLALLVLSGYLATHVDSELMPSFDEGTISISVTTRPGLKLDRVDEIVTGIEDMVAAHPDVEHYTMSAGGGILSLSSASTVTAYLEKDRAMSTAEVVEQWRLDTASILDCDIEISMDSMMSSMTADDAVSISLQGSDLDRLQEANAQIADLMYQHPDVLRVSSSYQDSAPQVEIIVDPMRAAAYNMIPSQVAQSVYAVLNGTEATDINLEERNYSIWVEYPEGSYQSVSDVANMILVLGPGASVALSDVARVEFTDAPQTIMREDNQYVATISGTVKADKLKSVTEDIQASMTTMTLPRGVEQRSNTMDTMMVEEFVALGTAIVIAILLVFMVMAIQFESAKHSLMVMICIPFSVVGSFGLLYLTGSTISMVSLLGFLILVGSVVNNGILFVDTANQYRQTMDVRDALVHTGQTRLRPILMTTLTTILSMLPLGLGIGTGGEMMQGMGVTVIGGLTAATILTLLLLPTFYLVIDGNAARKARRKENRGHRKARRAEKLKIKLQAQEERARQIEQKKQINKYGSHQPPDPEPADQAENAETQASPEDSSQGPEDSDSPDDDKS